MPRKPAPSEKPSPSAAALPPGLDAAARREIAESQAAMRALIARLPRRFGYADEVGFSFRPGDGE
jgi:hypothetical protein